MIIAENCFDAFLIFYFQDILQSSKRGIKNSKTKGDFHKNLLITSKYDGCLCLRGVVVIPYPGVLEMWV